MNDKKQLAAMGEHMAEQAAQPMCMAKRIEELEAQVRVMAGLLRETLNMVPAIGVQICDLPAVDDLLDRIDAAMAGKLPVPAAPIRLEFYDAGFLNAAGGGDTKWWCDYIRSELDRAYDFYQAQLDGQSLPTTAVPEGWKLVPVDPTPEMLIAINWPNDPIGYAVMLAASPSPDDTK